MWRCARRRLRFFVLFLQRKRRDASGCVSNGRRPVGRSDTSSSHPAIAICLFRFVFFVGGEEIAQQIDDWFFLAGHLSTCPPVGHLLVAGPPSTAAEDGAVSTRAQHGEDARISTEHIPPPAKKKEWKISKQVTVGKETHRKLVLRLECADGWGAVGTVVFFTSTQHRESQSDRFGVVKKVKDVLGRKRNDQSLRRH